MPVVPSFEEPFPRAPLSSYKILHFIDASYFPQPHSYRGWLGLLPEERDTAFGCREEQRQDGFFVGCSWKTVVVKEKESGIQSEGMVCEFLCDA